MPTYSPTGEECPRCKQAEAKYEGITAFATILVENYREIDSALQEAFRNIALLEARTAAGDVEKALRQANQNKQNHLNTLATKLESMRAERDALRERIGSIVDSLERGEKRFDAGRADDAIGLFLEYRDRHGCDEEQARAKAIGEFLDAAATLSPADKDDWIELNEKLSRRENTIAILTEKIHELETQVETLEQAFDEQRHANMVEADSLAEGEKILREEIEKLMGEVHMQRATINKVKTERDQARVEAERWKGHWDKTRNAPAERAWSEGYDQARIEGGNMIRMMREELPKKIHFAIQRFIKYQRDHDLSPTEAESRVINEAAGMNYVDETTRKPESKTAAAIPPEPKEEKDNDRADD